MPSGFPSSFVKRTAVQWLAMSFAIGSQRTAVIWLYATRTFF